MPFDSQLFGLHLASERSRLGMLAGDSLDLSFEDIVFDSSKHPRLHGKFTVSSKGNAQVGDYVMHGLGSNARVFRVTKIRPHDEDPLKEVLVGNRVMQTGKISKNAYQLGSRPKTRGGANLSTSKDSSWSSDEVKAFVKKHGSIAEGVGKKKDGVGYYIHTHRARSKSYKTPDAIPRAEVEFIESTG